MIEDMLPKFSEWRLFNFNVEVPEKRMCTRNLSERGKKPQTCYTKYDQNHFHQLSHPSMKRSIESEEFGPTYWKQSKRDFLPLGEILYFICNKPDINYCAARIMHASRTSVDKQHFKETTEMIKTMGIALDKKLILVKLSSGDIVSKELNYQNSF